MDKQKKRKGLELFRRACQLAAFIFLPGMFTTIFYAGKTIWTGILSGAGLGTMMPSMVIFFGVLILTALTGRFFCGFLCSFGAMGDLIWYLAKLTGKKKSSVSGQVDQALKLVKYLLLLGIVVGSWTLQLVTIDSTWNPWTVFGIYSDLGNWPGTKYIFSIGGLLLLGIMVGSFLIERFFCRYLCPLGGIFTFVSKFRLFRIKKTRQACGNCRLCSQKCAMGIPLDQYDEVRSGECIDCFACVEVCPKGNAVANPAPLVVSAVSAAAITGMVYGGSILPGNRLETAESGIEDQAQGKYTDGVYTGTGTGFRGETKVSVTVENGYISEITVVSYEDDGEYFSRAENTIINEIIQNQDTDVDAVSGATFSSEGIIQAVEDALNQQETGSQSADSQTSDSQTSDSQSADSQSVEGDDTNTLAQGDLNLEDGTYKGTGTGFRGETSVSVTVEGGSITDITVESFEDDQEFFSRAEETLISEILEEQNIDVDTVSGATFSSNGIKEAVADALGIDFTNPNSSMEGEHGGHGHGGRP